MFYLLFQMFLYMLVTLLLGLFLGWLLWRKGYGDVILRTLGIQPAADLAVASSDQTAGLTALREENSRLASELSTANASRSRLQNDLDDCRSAQSAAPAVSSPAALASSVVAASPAAAAVASKPAASAGTKPKGLSGARGGKADDLKRIKGIGPKLEKMLHGMGFYHFDQIAAWGASDLAWVDENLEGFKGRASRDNWIPQAKKLA